MNIYVYKLPINEGFYVDYAIKGLKQNSHNVFVKRPDFTRFAEIEFCKHNKIDLILFYGFAFMNHIKHQYDPRDPQIFFLPEVLKIPYAVHWCDDPRRYLLDLQWIKKTNYTFFVCDSVLVEKMREQGFDRTFYLATCFDPDIQRPMGKLADFACDVAFAGTVFSDQKILSSRVGLGAQDITALDHLRQTRTPGQYYDYIEKLDAFAPFENKSAIRQCALMEQKHDLRMDMFNALSEFALHVFGQGDGNLNDFPNFYRGRNLDQHHELPYLYNSAKVSLSIELLPASVHQRIMECCGCGGFILGEDKADMPKCFDDFVVWSNLDELKEKVKFYLEHEEDRNRMAASMHEQALKRHTAPIRMKEMVEQWQK